MPDKQRIEAGDYGKRRQIPYEELGAGEGGQQPVRSQGQSTSRIGKSSQGPAEDALQATTPRLELSAARNAALHNLYQSRLQTRGTGALWLSALST